MAACAPLSPPTATGLVELLSTAPPAVEKPTAPTRRYVPPPRRSRPHSPSPRDVIRAIRERRRKEGDLQLFDDFAA